MKYRVRIGKYSVLIGKIYIQHYKNEKHHTIIGKLGDKISSLFDVIEKLL